MRVFLNGVIHTMDRAHPRVEAVACERGYVVAAGRSDELRPLAATSDDVINLGGKTALPGLIDAHIHFQTLGLALGQVDLGGARSLAECVERVAARVAVTAPGRWILGRGWNQNEWQEGRWPARDDLDAIAPDRPIALNSKDGHLLWVNSAALRAAGISAASDDPSGGEIARDAHGDPSGVLKENATNAVYAVIPPPSDEEREAALARAMEHALALGLTSIGNFEGPEAYAAFERLRARGKLRLRVVHHIARGQLDAALEAGDYSGRGDDWLRTGQLKLFADGTLGSQTAAMLEPFEGTDNRGIARLSYDEMRADAWRAAQGGIATAIHAIGDRANREALRALIAAPLVPTAPHRIEHAQLLHPDDVHLFVDHGIVASMQPIHATGDRDTADRYWGARCATAYAWRVLRDNGAVLAFGSDAPVETADPLAGIYAAVARHNRDDGRAPWRPKLALTAQEAVWAYTVGAAAASGETGAKGTLAPGRVADLVVLSDDPCAGAEALEQARVVCTVVGGEVVASG